MKFRLVTVPASTAGFLLAQPRSEQIAYISFQTWNGFGIERQSSIPTALAIQAARMEESA